jgi:lipopolysaccharide export system permease protein
MLASILYFANRQIIPRGNEIRSNFHEKYFERQDFSRTGYQDTWYRRSDSNTYVGIKYFDTATKSAGTFFLHRTKGNKVVYNLRAESMRWDTAKKNWQLTNVAERKVDSNGEKLNFYPTFSINLNLKPEDLRYDYYLKDKLTTTQLKELIRMEEIRGTEGLSSLKVERYRRSATPVAVLLLTLVGAIISSRKTRGGSGLHIALGLIIASMFILTDRFSTTFSVKGDFHPMIAAWLPNILFALVAIRLYMRAPK